MVHSITPPEQELIRLLLTNSRMRIVAMGEHLGKSRNWVARALERLAKSRVIRAYTAVLNPARVYSERSTILLVKTNPRELRVSEALVRVPGLESLDGISGEYSLLGLFRFRMPAAFERFLDVVDGTVAQSGSNSYALVQVLTTYKAHGFIMDTSSSETAHLTQSEWELLSVLRRQPVSEDRPLPLTQTEIGRFMVQPLSQPAVSKAMRRLESSGVIVGYSADVDFRCVGLPIKFFLEIRAAPGAIGRAAHAIAKMQEVWDLHRTSEAFSLFATVRTGSVEEYNQFLRRLYRNKDVLETRSQISLEEWFIPLGLTR
ncbi:MAG: Lrp/AsnC family transcriptional regulator [Candidatus Thorarchaeota archaeon]